MKSLFITLLSITGTDWRRPLLSTFLAILLSPQIAFSQTPFFQAQAASTESNGLPELGDSATQYLSPVQESAIGQAFYRRLIANPAFISDYELKDYLQTIGDHIGQHAQLRGIPLTFSLIKNNDLNAFAVPGGYITFNSGLLMATDSESELASVISHEIAHLTQRHLPRLLAQADAQKIPALAAIIGSVLLGGQAGIAGITATTAAMASNQLRYSRNFEKEADAQGIQLLANTQYDPKAMAQFFGKLERFTRHDSTEIPEFLKTHPLSYTRIAESETRALEYSERTHKSSLEYYLARAKIRALIVEREDDPLLFFNDQLQSTTEFERDASGYGMSIVYLQSRDFDKARVTLQPLLLKYPSHAWVQALQSSIEIKMGDIDTAINRLKMILGKKPEKHFISYYLAKAYMTNNQPDLAKKTLRYQIRRHARDYVLYDLLSDAHADSGSIAEAHQTKAEYHAILGNYEKAVAILKLAQEETATESYLGQSIKARIPELEEKARLQKSASNI